MLVLRFQIGGQHLALDVRRVREVVPRVRLQPVACSPPWLAGVFLYRGHVIPVVELPRLFGQDECPPLLSSRIILIPIQLEGEEKLVGFLAAHVADICEIEPSSLSPARLQKPAEPDLGPVIVYDRQIVHLVEPDRLLPESHRCQLALVLRELPA